MSEESALYRPCVGLLILNDQGLVFAGERIDTPGAWQMPQGGVDPNEDIEKAAFREMKEEIGTDKADIIRSAPDKIRYETPLSIRADLQKQWGKPYIGQEQTWISFRFTGQDSDIDLEADKHPEFSQWQWMAFDDVLPLIVPFKRDVYEKVKTAFEDLLA